MSLLPSARALTACVLLYICVEHSYLLQRLDWWLFFLGTLLSPLRQARAYVTAVFSPNAEQLAMLVANYNILASV